MIDDRGEPVGADWQEGPSIRFSWAEASLLRFHYRSGESLLPTYWIYDIQNRGSHLPYPRKHESGSSVKSDVAFFPP